MAYLSKIGIDTGSARVYLALAACLAIQALQVYAEVEQQAGTSPAVEQVVTEYVVPEPSLTFGRYASIAFGLSSIAHVFYALHHRKQVELGYYGVLGAITAFLVGLGLNGYLNDRPLGLYYDAGIVLGGYSLAALVPTGSILADKNLEYFFTKSSQHHNTEIQDAITELEKTVTDMDATMTALKDPAKTKVTENSLKDLKCATLFLNLIVKAINASKYKPADYASLGKKLDQAIKTVQEEGIDKIISDKAKTDPTKWDDPATETTDTKIQAYKKYHTDYKELTYDKVGKAVPASGKGTDCVLTFKVSVTSAPVGAAQLLADLDAWEKKTTKTIDDAFAVFKDVALAYKDLPAADKTAVNAEFAKLVGYITGEIAKVTGYTTGIDATKDANTRPDALKLYNGFFTTLKGVAMPAAGPLLTPATSVTTELFAGDAAKIKNVLLGIEARAVEKAYTETAGANALNAVTDANTVKGKKFSEIVTLYNNILDQVPADTGFNLELLKGVSGATVTNITKATTQIGVIKQGLAAKLTALTSPTNDDITAVKKELPNFDTSKFNGKKENLVDAEYTAFRFAHDPDYVKELLDRMTIPPPSGVTTEQRVKNLLAVYIKFNAMTSGQRTALGNIAPTVGEELKDLKTALSAVSSKAPDYDTASTTHDTDAKKDIEDMIAAIGTLPGPALKETLVGTHANLNSAKDILADELTALNNAKALFSGTQYDNIKAIKKATTDVAAAVAAVDAGTGNLKVIADKIVVADGLLQTHATAATDTATAPVYGAPYKALQAACNKAFETKIKSAMTSLAAAADGTRVAYKKEDLAKYEELADAADALKAADAKRTTMSTTTTPIYADGVEPLKTLLEHLDNARNDHFNDNADSQCKADNTTVDAATSTPAHCALLVKEIKTALDLVPKGKNLDKSATAATDPINAKAVTLKGKVDGHIARVKKLMEDAKTAGNPGALDLYNALMAADVKINEVLLTPYTGASTDGIFATKLGELKTAAGVLP